MLKKSYVKSRKVGKVVFELPGSQLPEGIEAKSVHLVGDFNGWDAGATPMPYSKKLKAYRATLDLEPGKQYQFRYLINGETWCNDWEADEYVPSDFGEDNCIVVAPKANGSSA